MSDNLPIYGLGPRRTASGGEGFIGDDFQLANPHKGREAIAVEAFFARPVCLMS